MHPARGRLGAVAAALLVSALCASCSAEDGDARSDGARDAHADATDAVTGDRDGAPPSDLGRSDSARDAEADEATEDVAQNDIAADSDSAGDDVPQTPDADARGADAHRGDVGEADGLPTDIGDAPGADDSVPADVGADVATRMDGSPPDSDPGAGDASPDEEGGDEPIDPIERYDFSLHRIELEDVGLEIFSELTLALTAGDFDGDGRTDLFIGHRELAIHIIDGSPPPRGCIAFNRSRPGEIRFDRSEGACVDVAVAGSTALDVDADGRDELVVMKAHEDGDEEVELLTYRYRGPRDVEPGAGEGEEDADGTPVLARIASGHTVPSATCPTLLPFDLDFDGDGDLLVGCIPNSQAFLWSPDGWTPTAAPLPPLEIASVTFGIGGLDVDHDGLIDIVRYNDTFSYPGRVTRSFDPGGIYRPCPPDEDCRFRSPRWDYGVGDRVFGGFMGLATLHVDGIGELLYVTDAGYNRANEYGADGFVEDHARALGIDVGSFTDGRWVFSWSAITHDFDGDGRDDLYVANGAIDEEVRAHPELFAWSDHFDTVLMQADDSFEVLSEEVGVLPNDARDSIRRHPYSSRGLLKVDMDADGHVELLEMPVAGSPRLYTVDTRERRGCQLRPASRYVFAHGYGYAVERPEQPGVWRRWDMQGHFGVSTDDVVHTAVSEGVFRFPSGWTARFSCDGLEERVVAIEEPRWIVTARGEGGRVELSFESVSDRTPRPSRVEVVGRDADGVATLLSVSRADDGRWTTEPATDIVAVLLELDGRWIGRWIDVPEAP